MRHRTGCRPRRDHTILLRLLLLALPWAERLDAQVALGAGPTIVHVPSSRWTPGFGGGSVDLAVRTGGRAEFVVGFQEIRESGVDYPVGFTVLELGVQYRTAGRGPVQGVFGANFGFSARDEYDNDALGSTGSLHARLVVWPLREVGFFGEAYARFLDGAESVARGLTLGVALRTAP